jgi:hypothetical protein
MANPEQKEGQPIEVKTDFLEVPDSLKDTGITSVDTDRTPMPAIREKGEYLVKPSPVDRYFDYTDQQVGEMKRGSVNKTLTWLGQFVEYLRKKKAGSARGTA